MAFSQQGPRAVCIISATGAVSTATLHQDSDSGGVVTYEVCCCWLSFAPTAACMCLALSLVVHLNTNIWPLCKLNEVLAAGNWPHSRTACMSGLKLLLFLQIIFSMLKMPDCCPKASYSFSSLQCRFIRYFLFLCNCSLTVWSSEISFILFPYALL